MTDPTAAAVSFAKAPAASFIALFAGVIGYAAFGDDQSEVIRGATFLLLALGGAGAFVHTINWISWSCRTPYSPVRKLFRNGRYRRLTGRMCKRQLELFHACLLENTQYFPPSSASLWPGGRPRLSSSEQWIQDLQEKELASFINGDSSSRPFFAIDDDYWKWLERNRSFVKRRFEMTAASEPNDGAAK